MKYNRLKKSGSKYLQQHATNPVEWYPWGEEALRKAEEENKLLFISIGYAACHWCHVMERESFRNDEIAGILNKHFIAVKVDREERPDIDNSYMSAVQLMNGSGGWPLNCFATPDAKPFYGGTYFPATQFKDICLQIAGTWKDTPEKVREHAEGLCSGVQNAELVKVKSELTQFIVPEKIISQLKGEFDLVYGGQARVPKFPLPGYYKFLFKYAVYSKDESVANHALFTIKKILHSGMYDQVEGGIARYSVDKYWKVPHFEKMLYDNAQFISLLSIAYNHSKDPSLLKALDKNIQFTIEWFRSESGGYYSSIDSASENEEGKYYVWDYDEIQRTTGNDFQLVKDFYALKPEGNFENNKIILHAPLSLEDYSRKMSGNFSEYEESLERALISLHKVRKKRVKPEIDTKILSSWNAWMLIAFCDAYQSTGKIQYLKEAQNLAVFIKTNLIDPDNFVTRGKDLKITGFLDDYSYVANAFIHYYQVSFEKEYLDTAHEIVKKAYMHFFEKKTGMFYYTPDFENNPVARQSDTMDNVLPSANSVMAHNLFLLSTYTDELQYKADALQMLRNINPYINQSAGFFFNWSELLLMFRSEFSEIVFVGENYLKLREQFTGKNLPFTLFAGAEREEKSDLFKGRYKPGETLIYICKDKTCKRPVESIDEAWQQLINQ